VLIVAVLVLVAVAVNDDDNSTTASSDRDRDTTPTTEATDDEPDDEDTGTGTPPTEAELNAIVDDIKAFVEQERGLEFVEPVAVELADDTEFVDRLTEGMSSQSDYFSDVEVLYKALGLVDPDSTFAEDVEEMVGAGVVGFYDPESKELVVRATEITPFTRTVIAHELTHALDDQHFGLNRPEYEEASDESSFGFSALVEGNAMYVEEKYFSEELTDEEQDASIHEEMSASVSGGIPDVSFALLELMGAPYLYGPKLISAIRDDGGQERLDAAFSAPPNTSEQVVDPDKFIAGEGRAEVTHPAADGEAVFESVLGQLFIEVTLEETVSSRVAEEASEGWGGDWAAAWRDGDTSCMRMVMVGDTPEDSDELRDAWSEWADQHTGTATVDQATPGEAVTLTACN
jgi:hypothetical protein